MIIILIQLIVKRMLYFDSIQKYKLNKEIKILYSYIKKRLRFPFSLI